MLTIFGRKSGGYCDGISRRGFLKIGGLAFGSSLVTLPDVLRAEEAARLAGRPAKRHKAVINIFLAGGPPHQDMFDLKPEAPEEIRGEFKPIETNVPGIFIGETFPKLAGLMDRSAIIRSVVGATGRHDLYQCNAGYKFDDLQALGGRPSLGSIVSKMHGPVDPAVPALRRPGRHDPSRALERPRRRRLPRPGIRPVQARRAGPEEHDAQRDLRRAPGRPPLADAELRPPPPRGRRHRGPRRGRLGDGAGLRRPLVEQAGRRARPLEGGPEAPRQVRRRQALPVPVRRRPDLQRSAPDGPPAGRGRRPLRDAQLRPLGQPRPELRPRPRPRREARPVPLGPDRGPGGPRDARRHGRHRLGRVRPDAEGQQQRGPRPLAAGRRRLPRRRRPRRPAR